MTSQEAPKEASLAKEGSATVSTSNDKKLPAKRCYYAVRKGNNLTGPAIFTDKEDCSFHVEREEDEEAVDYKSFPTIAQAVQYAFGETLQAAATTTTTTTAAPSTTTTPTTATAATTTATPIATAPTTTPIADAWASMNAASFQAQPTSGALAWANATVAAAAAATVAASRKRTAGEASLPPQPLVSVKKLAPSVVPLLSSPASSAAPLNIATTAVATGNHSTQQQQQQQQDAAALANLPPDVRQLVAPAPKKSRGRTESARKVNWERNFQLLKEYKETHGTCNVSPANTQPGSKFAGLDTWFRYEQRRVKNHDSQKSTKETAEKVKRLLDLGLDVNYAPTTEKTHLAPGLKRTEKWERNFQSLQEFKQKHETCDITKASDKEKDTETFRKLKQWVRWTTDELLKYEEDPKTSALDAGRVQRLSDLGFVKKLKQEPSSNGGQKLKSGTWDEMFQQLVAFKEQHGHTNVPHLPRSALRNWSLLQRDHYVRLKEGKKCDLNAERVTKLLDLGFVLQAPPRLSFDQRAVEWLEYRTKHGRDPTYSDNESLATWVAKMRRKYACLKEGKATTMTQEQADKLTSWGFKWDSGMKKPEKVAERKSWDERYEELLAYKEKHGNVDVPQAYPQLGHWVHRQRREYRHLKLGKKNFMTPQKLAKLQEVGFKFLTRKSPKPRNSSKEGAAEESTSEEEEEDENVGLDGPSMLSYAASQHQQQRGHYNSRWL